MSRMPSAGVMREQERTADRACYCVLAGLTRHLQKSDFPQALRRLAPAPLSRRATPFLLGQSAGRGCGLIEPRSCSSGRRSRRGSPYHLIKGRSALQARLSGPRRSAPLVGRHLSSGLCGQFIPTELLRRMSAPGRPQRSDSSDSRTSAQKSQLRDPEMQRWPCRVRSLRSAWLFRISRRGSARIDSMSGVLADVEPLSARFAVVPRLRVSRLRLDEASAGGALEGGRAAQTRVGCEILAVIAQPSSGRGRRAQFRRSSMRAEH